MHEQPTEKLFGPFNWQWSVVSFGYMMIVIIPLAMMLPQILSVSAVSTLVFLVVGLPAPIGFYLCSRARGFVMTESSLGSIMGGICLYVLFHSLEPSFFPSLVFVPLSSALGSVLGQFWKLREKDLHTIPGTESPEE